jgi:hypothetical protein
MVFLATRENHHSKRSTGRTMIRIFVLAGQSNMVGAGITGQIPKAQRTTPQNVRLFEDGSWRDLLWRDAFGPEFTFAKEISTAFPNDQIVLCKVAQGGANLYYDWNPDGVSKGSEDDYRGPLYPKLIAELETLTTQLSTTQDPWEFSGMVWMQGERDSVFEFMAQAYEGNFVAFVEAIRRDTGNGELPFIIGQIAPRIYRLEEVRFQHAFRHVVQEAQQQVSCSNPLIELVETRDLPQSDNLHFDTGGQMELGKRFAKAYLLNLRKRI